MKQRSLVAFALSLAALALAVVLATGEPAHAATYTVDTTADNASLTACTAAANMPVPASAWPFVTGSLGVMRAASLSRAPWDREPPSLSPCPFDIRVVRK